MKSAIARCLALLLLAAATTPGQDEDFRPEGGSFAWKGRRVEIAAETLAHHLDIVGRIEPETDLATRLELAWGRAIRLEGARLEEIEVDEKAFQDWMRERHADFVATLREGRETPEEILEAWRAFMRERGFEDLASYEAACREEYRGELFVAIEFPTATIDDAALRRRYREIHTAYTVTALVFAAETLAERPELALENEEHRALFRSWWQQLSDERKRAIDDKERPASEAECLFVTFGDKSMAQLKEFFERPRPGMGTSLAEATAHYEMTELDRFKMGMRWVDYRRTMLAHINGELPAGLDDAESFELVKPHLEREWRILRYLGDLWQELRTATGPIDLRTVAELHGFEYRHYPLQPNYRIQEDRDGGGRLVGDHPLGFRRTKPGEIFDYNTRPESANKVYYVEGVVDQPGLHASIWRLIRYEPQRLLDADTAMPLAWQEFETANDYRVALERAAAFAALLEQRMAEALAAAAPADPAERARFERDFARREFAAFFDERKGLARSARVLGPFVARPFAEMGGLEKLRGTLDQRVLDFVAREWTRIVGPLGTAVEAGQILPIARSDPRGLALLLRIDAVHEPTASQYDRDPAGRERARRSLALDARQLRNDAARSAYRYPAIVRHFELEAPQLDRLMSEKIRKSLVK